MLIRDRINKRLNVKFEPRLTRVANNLSKLGLLGQFLNPVWTQFFNVTKFSSKHGDTKRQTSTYVLQYLENWSVLKHVKYYYTFQKGPAFYLYNVIDNYINVGFYKKELCLLYLFSQLKAPYNISSWKWKNCCFYVCCFLGLICFLSLIDDFIVFL